MEWQLKPSTWDLDVPQQAENDNHAMRSSNSLQIHNRQRGLQEDDYRGGVKVCIEGLVGKIQDQNHNHDANHIMGASQKGFHFPMPSTCGTNTTNTSLADSGSSSGFPAASTTDCSNGNQQAPPFPSKDPVKLRHYGWLYSGNTVEMPRVASGLNAGKGGNTNHSNNYANDDDNRNQKQQGYNSTINGKGGQLIGTNGGGACESKEIIIAPKRRYPKEDGMINRSEGVAMATGSAAYKKHRNMGSGGRVQVPRCQVDGCKEDLGKAKKDYHRRHKICEMHSKAPQVITSGVEQRFCQQCSRFHAISEFDDSKRSCRRRLAGHNERRRKSAQDTAALSLASMSQDDRRHLNYFIQHPLSMPLPTIYKNEDTRRSRSDLEEACRAKLALMNAGILPRNAANRLLSILHAYKGSPSSSTPHDVLKYSNTNNRDNNNNNPSIGEGLTLCSSNSININGGSQPSSGANSILAASLEATSQHQLGLLNSGRALSLLSDSGGGGARPNPIHHRAVLDPEILNHPIITSSCSSLNANFTQYHGHHRHQDQYQVNNNTALIPLFVDDNYPLKNPKLFTNSPRSLALSIGISTPSDNVDQPLMSNNSNDILAVSINNDQRFASSAHGLATGFSQHFHPFRAYESSSLFTGHADMQSHV